MIIEVVALSSSLFGVAGVVSLDVSFWLLYSSVSTVLVLWLLFVVGSIWIFIWWDGCEKWMDRCDDGLSGVFIVCLRCLLLLLGFGPFVVFFVG